MLSTWLRRFTPRPGAFIAPPVLRLARAAVGHLLWPWDCPLCGRAMARLSHNPVCPICLESLDARSLARGHGASPGGASAATPNCLYPADRRLAVAAIAFSGPYSGLLQQAICRWKFGGRTNLTPLLASLLTASLEQQDWSHLVDALVPVPQAWSRWLRRRFHPAGELALGVAAAVDRPVWPILRARHHRPQVGLNRAQRLRNVRGVFRMVGRMDLAGKTLCLVDDVSSTGATLDSAARRLLRRGALRVYGAVLARGQAPSADDAVI